MDDQELNRLLREWTAPDAPPHLRPRSARTRHGCDGWSPARFAYPYCGARGAVAPRVVDSLERVSMRPAPAPTPAPATSAPRPSGELARYPLTGPLEGFDAVLVEVNFRPGASSREHRHPGPILGYVVDGQMRIAINNSRTRSSRRGARFSSRPAPFIRRSVPRMRMRRSAPWHSWWYPLAARSRSVRRQG